MNEQGGSSHLSSLRDHTDPAPSRGVVNLLHHVEGREFFKKSDLKKKGRKIKGLKRRKGQIRE